MVFEDLGESKVDISRSKIKGFPEIIYGEYKTAEQIKNILEVLADHDGKALATRVSYEKWTYIKKYFPQFQYHESAQMITFEDKPSNKLPGKVLIISAGTSDFPVSEEAKVTAKWMGCKVETIYDVGVAGISRLLSYLNKIREANIIIVVAGMEGALPSVVSGLVNTPLIAVPTSVGYGANQGGMTTMHAMLTSCSSGLSVVNIDNGFGAAYQAALFLNQFKEMTKDE